MRFQPVPIRLNLTPEEVARFAVDGYRFPGVEVHAELIRTYPKRELTAHVLGYVGRINEKELARIDKGNYAGTNFIGKGGVEMAHEDVLHGKVGYQQVEVNARGRILRTLESTPPAPGQDLYLYLDIALQKAATEALGTYRGSIVAIDPRNGGVLAMVSAPSFDPNLFVEGISQTDYNSPAPFTRQAALQSFHPRPVSARLHDQTLHRTRGSVAGLHHAAQDDLLPRLLLTAGSEAPLPLLASRRTWHGRPGAEYRAIL
jgi:cell division protein FtsI/penicillin-binding protein 2